MKIHYIGKSYIGKSLDEIMAIDFFDAAGYFYRSMSWLDYHKRTGKFSSLLYACIEGRSGIEYLLFEELIISTGANLSLEDYKKCVKEKNRFIKTIRKVAPEYERMQEFTKILLSLGTSDLVFIYWNHNSLMKDWGVLSNYLHWFGARRLTTENPRELKSYLVNIERVLLPIWENITSGQSGIMHPRDMKPVVRDIWEQFRTYKINAAQAKFQLDYCRPLAKLQKVSQA